MSDPIHEVDYDVLLTYVVASADMRYIEIGEREVYLRIEPEIGPVVCAAMPNSRPGCEVNLSEILLEVALTSEGRTEGREPAESAGLFGIRLGRLLAVKLCQDSSSVETITSAFECILNSMQVPFTMEADPDRICFHLAYAPLVEAARGMGSNRGLPSAHRSFLALCKTMLRIMAPDWAMEAPSELDASFKLLEITRSGHR